MRTLASIRLVAALTLAGEDYEALAVKEGGEEIAVTISNGKMVTARVQ